MKKVSNVEETDEGCRKIPRGWCRENELAGGFSGDEEGKHTWWRKGTGNEGMGSKVSRSATKWNKTQRDGVWSDVQENSNAEEIRGLLEFKSVKTRFNGLLGMFKRVCCFPGGNVKLR